MQFKGKDFKSTVKADSSTPPVVDSHIMQVQQMENEILKTSELINRLEEERKKYISDNVSYKGFSVTCPPTQGIRAQRRIDGELYQMQCKKNERMLQIMEKIDEYIEANKEKVPKLLEWD